MKAAEQNFAKAQMMVSQCYAKGEGTEMSPVQSSAWLMRAAQGGDEDAKKILASSMLKFGEIMKAFRKNLDDDEDED